MKQRLIRLVPLAAALIVASCSGIGPGNTLVSLEIVPSAVAIEQGRIIDDGVHPKYFRMYDCLCSNFAVIGTFTDGSRADFSYRAKWSVNKGAGFIETRNYGDANLTTAEPSNCALSQRLPGVLIPLGPSDAGTNSNVAARNDDTDVEIKAEFVGLTATMPVQIVTADASLYSLTPSTLSTGTSITGTLTLNANLEGRSRVVTGHGSWGLKQGVTPVPACSDSSATAPLPACVNTIGQVTGIVPDMGTPLTAEVTPLACVGRSIPGFPKTATVRVGTVLSPVVLDYQSGFGAGTLIVKTNEMMKVTGKLDFNNDGTQDAGATTDLSFLSRVNELCVSHTCDGLGACPGPAVADDLCDFTVPLCSSPAATLTKAAKCRDVAANLAISGTELAAKDVIDARLKAIFPFATGATTTLTGDIGSGATTFTVTALKGYPSPPYEAVIGCIAAPSAPCTPETVIVTDVTDTTLTVLRAQANTTAVAHAAADSTFDQRFIESGTPKDLDVLAGVLTDVQITTAPGAPIAAFATTQLAATGDFDTAITQDITRLSAFASLPTPKPSLSWTSSSSRVAVVSNAVLIKGLVTATGECGGTVVVRARADTSADAESKPNSDLTVTTDDDHCLGNAGLAIADDPLCDQVCVTVAPLSPLPVGAEHDCDVTADNPTPAPHDAACP